METVAYVFTDISLVFFGQPQPLLFIKNDLQLLKEKALEMIPKYGRTEYQSVSEKMMGEDMRFRNS